VAVKGQPNSCRNGLGIKPKLATSAIMNTGQQPGDRAVFDVTSQSLVLVSTER
jgi:hypothetical protein